MVFKLLVNTKEENYPSHQSDPALQDEISPYECGFCIFSSVVDKFFQIIGKNLQ